MKSVSLEKLAAALPPFPWRFPPGAVAASPLPILFESRRKKLQRFLSLPIFQVEKLWFAIIKSWLAAVFTSNQTIYALTDSNWLGLYQLNPSFVTLGE
jgi:hypothetical protein